MHTHWEKGKTHTKINSNTERGLELYIIPTSKNAFVYLRLYGITHMVKDHSDNDRGNPLLPHGLLFLISSKGSVICIIPDRITHTTAFVTPVVEHWLEQEIAQWVHHEGSDDPSHHERTLLPRSYISPPCDYKNRPSYLHEHQFYFIFNL